MTRAELFSPAGTAAAAASFAAATPFRHALLRDVFDAALLRRARSCGRGHGRADAACGRAHGRQGPRHRRRGRYGLGRRRR
jgi:hypothetical protein